MTMTPSLLQRSALLREACRSNDADDLSAYVQALDDASEADRVVLARALPPSRLFKAEGPTPRACYALVALGRPKLVAETLAAADVQRQREFSHRHAAMVPVVIDAAAARDAQWRTEFIDLLAQQYWWGADLVWPVCQALVRQGGAVPHSLAYLGCFVQQVTSVGADGLPADEHGLRMAAHLQAHADLLEQEFRALFCVEGMGVHHFLVEHAAPAWDAAVLELCKADAAFRQRLLDESLDALLRDFSAKNIAWYLRMHRLVDPVAQEIAARQHAYFAVLGTAPSTAAGLAQEMLKVASGLLDADGLIEASPGVLVRQEKKLVKAQLGLLAAIQADAAQKARISQIVSEAIEGMALDLASLARKLVSDPGEPAAGAHAVQALAPAVAVPAPRRTPLPGAARELPSIRDDEELLALIAAQLEDAGQGTDLQRLLGCLAGQPDVALPDTLQQRAAQVLESVWDERNASPRRLLAALLLGREVGFRGYARFVVLGPGEQIPCDVALEEQILTTNRYDPGTGDWAVDETWTSRSGYRYVRTHSPLALLAGMFQRLRLAARQGPPLRPPSVLPARSFLWKRVLAQPGEGTFSRDLEVLGEGAKPFWVVDGQAGPVDGHAVPDGPDMLEDQALDVAGVASEFSFRAQEAREQDGYDQIVQWAAWLLQDNPDTLAAHFHPMLCAAVAVVNVRGLGPLLAALGASRQVPGGPVYSALALAASAKMAEQRAQAAEALAQLAGSGLLDPAPFAEQTAAHLADGFALAGRLAQTLADAASISAVAGYRVLQTLGELLARLVDAEGKPLAQAGKLVELAARLSGDYGTPLPIPAALLARRKGASALAVALKVLESVQPHPTTQAREAATAAQAANEVESPA